MFALYEKDDFTEVFKNLVRYRSVKVIFWIRKIRLLLIIKMLKVFAA